MQDAQLIIVDLFVGSVATGVRVEKFELHDRRWIEGPAVLAGIPEKGWVNECVARWRGEGDQRTFARDRPFVAL